MNPLISGRVSNSRSDFGRSSGSTFPDELARLARFGANITDAFGCFIFLPDRIARLSPEQQSSTYQAPGFTDSGVSGQGDLLRLVGFHSLSNDVISDARIAIDSGLIGWVAKHGKSIHVSPFERDSRTLGVYSSDQQLKSFIGTPVTLTDTSSTGASAAQPCYGVIACDSRKAFAFSKLQGKLLEELAEQVASMVRLSLQNTSLSDLSSWETFLHHGNELVSALGSSTIEALRVRITNFHALETKVGAKYLSGLLDQFTRLVRQALPPHSPLTQMHNGDVVILVDNMMTSFYEAKIQAIAQHVSPADETLKLEFSRSLKRKNRSENQSIEALVAETIPAPTTQSAQTQTPQASVTRLERVAYGFR